MPERLRWPLATCKRLGWARKPLLRAASLLLSCHTSRMLGTPWLCG